MRSFFKSCLFAVLFSLILVSCKKKETKEETIPEKIEPTACFSVSDQYIQPGESVQLTNCSSNYESCSWLFGDGESSVQNSPEHIFKTKGLYNVHLEAKNGDKTSGKELTVACGMKASTTLTINFSNWQFSSDFFNKGYLITITTLLYNTNPNTEVGTYLNQVTVYPDVLPYRDKVVIEVPLPDDSKKYILVTHFTGVYDIKSESNADLFKTEKLGDLTINNLDMFSLPRPSGEKKLNNVTLNYSFSETKFN